MRRDITQYGEWAVVTGASDGIGRAFARELASRGVHVVLVARREARLRELAEQLEAAHGVRAMVLPADLGEREGVDALLEGTRGLDVGVYVASAGFGTSGAFLSSPVDAELNMIDVNCRAVAETTHHFGRAFVARGRGAIVLLSSLVGFQGVENAANYAATKAYIQSLAEGLGQELAGTGVDVLAVAPGPIGSGFAARANMSMSNPPGPEVVPPPALAALGRWRTVRPGFLSKLLEYSLKLLPRWGRVRVMGLVMGGMTAHQRAHDASPP
jgi:hypothetical protein